MLYKTFIIPANSPAFAENSLNKFLQEHLIVSVTHEFSQPNNSWNFLVEYLENNNQPSVKKKIDYINICTKEEFAVFSKIREWRKNLSIQNKIPPYVILTDQQIYEIIKRRICSKTALAEINGIGNEKIEKYGNAIIELLGVSKNENTEIPF